MHQSTDLFRQHRHLILLVILLLAGFVQPLAHGFVGGLVLFDTLLSVSFLCIVLAVFQRRGDRTVAMCLAVPTIVARWVAYASSGNVQTALNVGHSFLTTVFMGFAILVLIREIFSNDLINSDHVLGTVCGYLLAGVAWGNCYIVADMLLPEAFRLAPEVAAQLQDDHVRSFYFNYFSFCALTGAGFGDITPLRPMVATLSWVEAAFGQFYIAVVVAQLVSLKLSQGRGSPPADP